MSIKSLLLNRNLGSGDVSVKNGVVKLSNGKYINEVVIPSLTPGICMGMDNDKVLVSFEKGNSYLAFGPGLAAIPPTIMYCMATEWKLGTAQVTYDAEKFRARCGTCSDVASATLVIRKKQLEKWKRKTRTATGRSVFEIRGVVNVGFAEPLISDPAPPFVRSSMISIFPSQMDSVPGPSLEGLTSFTR